MRSSRRKDVRGYQALHKNEADVSRANSGNSIMGPWVEKLSPSQIQQLTVRDQPNPFFLCGSSLFAR